MKYNYFLVLIIIVCICASYVSVYKLTADPAKTPGDGVISEYLKGATTDGDVGEEGSFAATEKNMPAAGGGQSSQERTRILNDGSKIDTMYDGFGNKTETRCFANHPRLNCVILTTSAANGQRQALVYGQAGDIKALPEDILDRAATAPADEIANSAGIHATRPTQSVYIQPTPLPTMPKPVRGNLPPLQPVPVEPVPAETVKSPEITVDNSQIKSSPTVRDVEPKDTANRKP